MKIENKNKYKGLYLPQILSLLKKELKRLWVKWTEETNAVDTIQFELVFKGWYMQCGIGVYEPYEISYRVVWEQKYKKCPPCKFVGEVEHLLLH